MFSAVLFFLAEFTFHLLTESFLGIFDEQRG